MTIALPKPQPGSQRFHNGEIHRWYRMVWGYPDHLVAYLIDKFGLDHDAQLLDPFVGAGTTLVEGQKRQLKCVGLDANPVAVFASQVKTNWTIKSSAIERLVPIVFDEYYQRHPSSARTPDDLSFQYLEKAGFIHRGWIRRANLRRAIALKQSIRAVRCKTAERNLLMLALLSTVVRDMSNVRFGPELYCGDERELIHAERAWAARVTEMVEDLNLVADVSRRAVVVEGDARSVTASLRSACHARLSDALICSPPYPAEHDYTRNTRMELALLERVTDIDSLRSVKEAMIRSHTKNIYIRDRDKKLVLDIPDVVRVARKVAKLAEDKDHGFARYYSPVILEYFGGMSRHFRSVRGVLKPGASCAYVVGQQASYGSVHIRTAELLAQVAKAAGFTVVGVETWRSRKSSTTAVSIAEEILILQR